MNPKINDDLLQLNGLKNDELFDSVLNENDGNNIFVE